MKYRQVCLCVTAILIAAAVAGPGAAQQSSGGEFTITRSVIAGGGGNQSGGEFAVTGVTGQAAVGQSEGGEFSLKGGFFASDVQPLSGEIFLDGFEAR
ncbi:MAG: hypothetical protein AAGA23_03475 [Pseudomonadota bacterium]